MKKETEKVTIYSQGYGWVTEEGKYLSVGQVRAMADKGVSFEIHTTQNTKCVNA